MIKLLVAEDEPKTLAAVVSRLRAILGDSGLVETAENGAAAVTKALQVRPQLIFMDIEMPVKTGLEAAAVINKQLPETHIVFLTAYDRFDYAVGALRSGAEEYLLKPVSEEALREVLGRFFQVEPPPQAATPFEAELDIWVRQHYAEDLSLEDAASSMGMSPFYFSRQVKAATGRTFLEFFTAYRIDRAKRRLESTEMSVSEVGRSVGYTDSNYFAKAFKRAVGCTPSVYRSRVREQSERQR